MFFKNTSIRKEIHCVSGTLLPLLGFSQNAQHNTFIVCSGALKSEPMMTLNLLPQCYSWRFHCLTKITRFKCQASCNMKRKPTVPGFFHLLLRSGVHPYCSWPLCANPPGPHLPTPLLSSFPLGQPRIGGQENLVVVSFNERSQFLLEETLSTHYSLWVLLFLQPSTFRSRSSGDPGCYQPPGPALSFWFPYTLPKSSKTFL